MIAFSTSGSAPGAPHPPGLQESTKSSLHLAWAKRACDDLPEDLVQAAGPILTCIEALNVQLAQAQRDILRMCREDFPHTARLTQVRGVGPVTAL